MLSQLRFKKFKSFAKASMPVEPITILIGANASGKSNAIDGIQILSGLATNRELIDILDGIRGQETGIRGGSRGAPRYDSASFELGCFFDYGEYSLLYDIKIGVKPRVWLLSESLYKKVSGSKQKRLVYKTSEPDEMSGNIQVTYHTNQRGRNPSVPFLRNYSILSQIPGRFPANSDVAAEVKEIFDKVTSILKGILILNPVPHLMREYVHRSRTKLVPTAENLSAVIADLIKKQDTKQLILKYLQDFPEQQILDIKVLETPTGDVMLSFVEQFGARSKPVDIRGMSDGTLRFLSILAALVGEKPGTTVVVEEVDNGLHPSRAYKLIGALRELGKQRGIDVIVTTHNPAVLNAVKAEDVPGVVVCYRDAVEGDSRFVSWVDLPNYPELMAKGRIGDIVMQGLVNLQSPAVKKREDLMRWAEGRLGN
ncbi:AAA family ATPase [Desulfoscipio geothermicus]|uniref:Predicted ATPase n=1 Tax=Desulfoscipio geothermicus DSM 3669 TaxID=1121426 RepID=A0A1I6EI75_9FIRM|nr:AAA family ATPase [Desulfoscipio geothermicus]SFR17218.1 Predicted ATPase [Desulfoscipio geothermicus DSM 3669]